MKQYPDVFQYDERLLVFLADHVFSGLFGTFLGDNERERTKDLKCRNETVRKRKKRKRRDKGGVMRLGDE